MGLSQKSGTHSFLGCRTTYGKPAAQKGATPEISACMKETVWDAYIDDVVRQNNETLDPTAFSPLGIYIYVLQDPGTKRILYVGKGGGADSGAGSNMRVFQHFDEAEGWIRKRKLNDGMSDKVRSIVDIWSRGEAVYWFVVRHNLRNDEEAFHIESALIDALP